MLLFAVAVFVASARAASFDVSVNSDFSYDISVGGEVWLNSGSTFVSVDGRTFSTKDGSLALKNITTSHGSDSGGAYSKHDAIWSAGGKTWGTFVKTYAEHAVFGQYFLEAFSSTNVTTSAHVQSSFPSFKIETPTAKRGFVSYQGDMVGGEGTKTGLWGPNTKDLGTGIAGTGPVVLFNEDASSSLVISAFSNFMIFNQDIVDSEFLLGIMGSVTNAPAGYVVETIVSLGTGINEAMLAWGDHLLAQYGKHRYAYKRDFALNFLGYSTDNGAYYYYQTVPDKTYEDTLIDVYNYATDAGIPYRYVLLDSWWYFKGLGSGVSRWDAMPSIFPHGLEYLYNVTNWPQQLHNRYWASNTSYAKQNGGEWNFLIDNEQQIALPLDPAFWTMLMETKVKTGMIMYEQDWLDVQFDRTPQLQQSPELARNWMMQMGTAAARVGATIQECMSHVRHVLQSVELPAITNARASDDYHPGNSQWNIGTSSILAQAVGIAPSKDNYWSTDVQDGTHYGPTTKEPYNRMQSAVSSFSTGPVAPSDKIGSSNTALITSACMLDGTLLQPTVPATAMDSHFLYLAFGSGAAGELWHSHTIINEYRVSYVIAIDMASAYSLSWAELGYNDTAVVVVEANATTTPVPFDASSPLAIKACGRWDFQLYTVSPVYNGFALLGEPNKWVRVSEERFSDPVFDDQGFSVVVKGTPQEVVLVDVLRPSGIVTVSCTIPTTTTAHVVVGASTAVCIPM